MCDWATKLWSKVDICSEDECWVCQTKPSVGGYRRIKIDGVSYRAHRLAWELSHGPIPDGLVVRHRCPTGPNPGCCNPKHLQLGSHADNVADREADGNTARGDRHGLRIHPERIARGERHGSRTKPERLCRGDENVARKHPELMPRGERHGRAKLTASKVRGIRAWGAKGWTHAQLAVAFHVRKPTIGQVLRRETWKHIE